jgi:hypothetical protein
VVVVAVMWLGIFVGFGVCVTCAGFEDEDGLEKEMKIM